MHLLTEVINDIVLNPRKIIDLVQSDNEQYLDPGIVASRLPQNTKPSLLPVNSSNKPMASLPNSTSIELAKEWQWVRLRNKASPGNDILQVGPGSMTPKDIMSKVIEWEAANPGQYIAAFDTAGWLKSKMVKTSHLVHRPGTDLFIRVLIDEKWTFHPGYNFGEADQPHLEGIRPSAASSHSHDIDIVSVLKMCNTSRMDVLAFMSTGYIQNKGTVRLEQDDGFGGQPHLGTWVRK
jgi:hypothetical protein